MLRLALFAAAVVGAVSLSTPAADPPAGSWLLTRVLPTGESAVCIVKVEDKDGKPAASVVFAPKGTEVTIDGFAATGKEVSFSLKMVQTFGTQRLVSQLKFVGTPGKDGKVVLGSLGLDARPMRAKLTATDKTELEARDLTVKTDATDAYLKVMQFQNKAFTFQVRAQQEKDAEKKKELLKQAADARAEVQEKLPGMLRELIAAHPDTAAAADAAMALLRLPQAKLEAGEAEKLVALIEKEAEPYGPRFAKSAVTQLADALAPRKDAAEVAVKVIAPLAKGLTDADKAADQVKVLTLYKTALENAGKAAEAKAIDSRLVKLEERLDAEYLATVPPFKPVAFAGRKERGANQVAVMELFTGAQCPPCVAADVAFDALAKSYKPTELVLIQYHMHIPGPDPMTNPDAIARWDYYREKFPEGIRGTPSTVFNGKPAAGGGGGMANAESKFKQYADIIDPLLEKTTPVKVGGAAHRSGDKIDIAVEVAGLEDTADLRLRLLVVEDTVRFVGGNQLRFHHHVVRAMPGGADGVAVKDKTFAHKATADVGAIRKDLEKYLTDFAANERPFPQPARPLEMKNLKVIALVQNDKTREIVQAGLFEVEGKPAAGE